MTALEERSDTELLQLLQQLGNLRGQAKTLATAQQSTQTEVTRQVQVLKSLATSTQIQKVTDAVTSAQVAAFGEKGSVFNKNNLLLAGNQILWGLLDPLMRLYGLDFGMSPSPIAYLAPLGSLALGAVTVGRTQHERFLADVSTIPPNTLVLEVDLRPRIAPADRSDFAARDDVLVTAQALDELSDSEGSTTLDARVNRGTLFLSLSQRHAQAKRVTWLVDTGLGGG